MKVSPEKLRAWAETLEVIQSKLPTDVSYYHLENYGQIRNYINLLLQQAEKEAGPRHD